MYLHLGNNTVIRTDELIGIFDLEKTTVSGHTRRYLAKATAADAVVSVTTELPRSFVVTEKEGKQTVYISQIAPTTLKRRADVQEANRLEIKE